MIKELFGFTSFDIGSSSDNQNMIIDIDGHSYLLTELGSGLADRGAHLQSCAHYVSNLVLILSLT